MSHLRAGDRVPDVSLVGPDGAPVPLSRLYADKTLVLYFYPKDDTAGCTAEACSFRDSYEDFLAAGAHVVGVSADPPASHARFAGKYRLPFTLLSDPTGAGRAAFGVKKTLGFFEGRVTFVIDRGGVVRHAFSSQIRMGAHVDEALTVVRQLASAHTPS